MTLLTLLLNHMEGGGRGVEETLKMGAVALCSYLKIFLESGAFNFAEKMHK